MRAIDEPGGLAQIHNVNVQELKKRLSGGFRPFAIRTTDGQEFVIPHPEFLLIGKYSIAIRDKEGFINTRHVSVPEDNPLYRFTLFSRHPCGGDFWLKVLRIDERGQRELL